MFLHPPHIMPNMCCSVHWDVLQCALKCASEVCRTRLTLYIHRIENERKNVRENELDKDVKKHRLLHVYVSQRRAFVGVPEVCMCHSFMHVYVYVSQR